MVALLSSSVAVSSRATPNDTAMPTNIQPAPGSSKFKGIPIYAIVVPAVVGFVLICLIVTYFVLRVRRKRRRCDSSEGLIDSEQGNRRRNRLRKSKLPQTMRQNSGEQANVCVYVHSSFTKCNANLRLVERHNKVRSIKLFYLFNKV